MVNGFVYDKNLKFVDTCYDLPYQLQYPGKFLVKPNGKVNNSNKNTQTLTMTSKIIPIIQEEGFRHFIQSKILEEDPICPLHEKSVSLFGKRIFIRLQ